MLRNSIRKDRTSSASFGTEFARHARHVLALLQAPSSVAGSVWSFLPDLRAMQLLQEGLGSTVKAHYRRKRMRYGRASADGDGQKWPMC